MGLLTRMASEMGVRKYYVGVDSESVVTILGVLRGSTRAQLVSMESVYAYI